MECALFHEPLVSLLILKGLGISVDINNLNTIYEKLQDDHSKNLFTNRLMYITTNDIKYIINENLLDADYYQTLINNIDSPVVVFTSGYFGTMICNTLLSIGVKIKAVCNTFSLEHKKETFCGINVISIDTILKDYDDCYIVLILTGNRLSLKKEIKYLINNGISIEKMIIPQTRRQYFDFIKHKPHKQEIYIDAGGYYGDTILSFLRWCDNEYKKIYVSEPDLRNYDLLNNTINDHHIENVVIHNKGLWSSSTKLNFSAKDLSVNELGESVMETDTIDNIVGNDPVTLIKFDIEGSELEALKGAYNTIKTNKPTLAICIYHKPEDIIDIPLYIIKNHNYYNLYIRKYTWYPVETVLYCIPYK